MPGSSPADGTSPVPPDDPGDAPAAEDPEDPGGRPPAPLLEPTPPVEDLPRQRALIELDLATLVYLGLGVLGAWLTLALFRAASEFLAPIAVGVVLALALDQPVSRMRTRYRCRRSTAVIGVCATLVVAVTLLVVFLGPPAVRQAASFGQELPQTVEDLYDLPVAGPRLERADAAGSVTEWVDELPSNVSSEAVADMLDRLVGGITVAMVVVLVAVSVLLDGELTVSRIRRSIPERHRPRADWLGGILYRTFGRYFAGALLLALMSGAYVLTVGLALGIPLAPMVAIWAMVTNLIPQVGGFLGGSVLVALALTVGLTTGLLALALFLAYNSAENYLIQPTVVGSAVQLSPPATMIAALVGGVSAGVPGALIATPLVATAKAAYVELRFGQPAEPEPPTRSLPLVGPLHRLLARRRTTGDASPG